MANRLTGEDRDVITSKLTLAEASCALPGTGGLFVNGATVTLPFNSEHADDVRRHLDAGMAVVRAWDVLWPADGSAPRTISDTGDLR